MKEYQIEIFRKTAEIINENTRGCRNKEEEITEKTMLTQHKRVKLFDIIGKVEK